MANPVDDLLTAYAKGANFYEVPGTNKWRAFNCNGGLIVDDAPSLAEAARLFCKELDLTPSSPDAILAGICAQYDGYDKLPEFRVGFDSHESGRFTRNPYNPDSVAAQAWDRGYEAAARYKRALDAAERGAVVERCRMGKAVREC